MVQEIQFPCIFQHKLACSQQPENDMFTVCKGMRFYSFKIYINFVEISENVFKLEDDDAHTTSQNI